MEYTDTLFKFVYRGWYLKEDSICCHVNHYNL